MMPISHRISLWLHEGLPERRPFPRIVLEMDTNAARGGLSIHREDRNLDRETARQLQNQLDAAQAMCSPCPRLYVSTPLKVAGWACYAGLAAGAGAAALAVTCLLPLAAALGCAIAVAGVAAVATYLVAMARLKPDLRAAFVAAPLEAMDAQPPTVHREGDLDVFFETPRYHPYAGTSTQPKTRELMLPPLAGSPPYVLAKAFDGFAPGRLHLPPPGAAIFSSINAAQHFDGEGWSPYYQAQALLCRGFSSDLAAQLAASIHSLLFPDRHHQIEPAIRHAWTLDWYNTFRSNLPWKSKQHTLYVHSIVAVTTPQRVYVVAQGNCSAHLVSGDAIRCLYAGGRLQDGATRTEVEACYGAPQVLGDLPFKLEATTAKIKHVPHVLTFERRDIADGLLVLGSPGSFARLKRTRGPTTAAFLHEVMAHPAQGINTSIYTGERFGTLSNDNCFSLVKPYSMEREP